MALDLPTEEDVLQLDYTDADITSNLLISEEDEEDDIFTVPRRAAQATALAASQTNDGSGTPAPPSSTLDMLEVCKRVTARLDIPWPAAVAETTRSRYEGKAFALARRSAKQPLPAFPELLEEMARSLKDCPYSCKNPIPGVSSLDCKAMKTWSAPHSSNGAVRRCPPPPQAVDDVLLKFDPAF